MRLRVLASFGILLGTLLLASVAFAAGYPEESPGLGNSTVWVMNVHESLDANVVASFFDRDGFETDSEQATIDSLGNASFPPSTPDLDSGWLGSVAIDSLRPIASIAETVWEDVPRGDYWSASAFNDSPEGANEIFFPGIVKSSYYRSYTTIQCLDTDDCDVSMTYRDQEGNLITGSPFLDTIEPFSEETYDLWDPSLNPNIPEQQYTTSPWYGNLQVTSTQQIAGVARTHAKPGHASAYNAIPATTDTEVFFPGYNRRNWNNWQGVSDWSTITIKNPNAVAVTVYLNFYNPDGTRQLTCTHEIDPYGSHSYNAKVGTDCNYADLTHPFSGPALVTSAHPIVGVCNLTRAPSDGLSAAYAGVSSGAQKLVFPVGYRVKEGTAWRKYSGVGIQNLDPQNQITVHLSWRDSEGESKLTFTDTIPAYGADGYNTRYGGAAYEALGINWKGTVVVTTTSAAGIAGVIGNTAKTPDYMYLSQYNGIPVE